ncbi:hypothetical protein [Glutamicibacter uratoxydans]|nr:hypothetical protein [Glutamicibacter uratoxydans]
MSPDKRQRRSAGKGPREKAPSPAIKIMSSSDDEHLIVYFKRNMNEDPSESIPGRDFLNSCPPSVRAKMRAVLVAVASAPPKKFSGGGYLEAMHDEMVGWFEIRVDGPGRRHYRLFCRLDYDALEMTKPLLVVIDGRSKPFRTVLSESEYSQIRKLGDEYFANNPRHIT